LFFNLIAAKIHFSKNRQPALVEKNMENSLLRALQVKMWLLRRSENYQGNDGETGNVVHCRCRRKQPW
jgi:hypothetical protein